MIDRYTFRPVEINGESVTRLVDKDGNDAPPAYTVTGSDGKTKIPVCKPIPVDLVCSDCKSKVHVFASVIHGETRVLCVQCLTELAGRWYDVVYSNKS